MHSRARLGTSVWGQQPCPLGTSHLPLNSIKLVPAKDWDFLRYNVRPGDEIPQDRRATTNLIRFWFKCQTPISYHMQHSKLHLDIAVSCTCSLLWRREWMTCGTQEQAPRTTWNTHLGSTDQTLPLVILLMRFFFPQCYHTIHRTKVPQRLHSRKGAWHCHCALFCKLFALSLLHARRLLRKLMNTGLILQPTHIAQLVYIYTYTAFNQVRALTGWHAKYWMIQRR